MPDYCSWAGGGGGGYTSTKLGVNVNPGDVIPVVVGAGQTAEDGSGPKKSIAPSSSVGSICSANGGFSSYNPKNGVPIIGGDGGSGGGYAGANGGSDGSNGKGPTPSLIGGIGQGTTTRYFGESNGTLYAGGGAGGGNHLYCVQEISGGTDCTIDDLNNKADKLYHLGGAGGGGNGSLYVRATIWNGGHIISSGTNMIRPYANGSAGTGGGGGGRGGAGGSGICIIRWGK